MKKLLIIFLALLALLMLAGCSNNKPDADSGISSQISALTDSATEKEARQKLKETLALVKTGEAKELLKKTYSSETVLPQVLLWQFDPLRSFQITPEHYREQFGFEFLRKINGERMYSIQKMDTGGRLYSFFTGEEIEASRAWLTNAIYVEKKLKKSDFSSVKAGDPITEVESIDPAVTQYRRATERVNETIQSGEKNPMVSYSLLTDGLYVISYTPGADNTPVVDKIEYYPDSKIETKSSLGTVLFDYSILPADYPD